MLNTNAEGEINEQADAAPSPSALQQMSTPLDPWSLSLDMPHAQPKRTLVSLPPQESTGTFYILVDRICNIRGYMALLAHESLLYTGVPRSCISLPAYYCFLCMRVYLPAPFRHICMNHRDVGVSTLLCLLHMTGLSECGPSHPGSFAWSTLTFLIALLMLSYANRLSCPASGPADSRPVDGASLHLSCL